MKTTTLPPKTAVSRIAIIDYGSQYTKVIGRSLREEGYNSTTLRPDEALAWAMENKPKAIILSGGPASVTDENAPKIPDELFELEHPEGGRVPVLGICYGMQDIAVRHGGKTASVTSNREYGPSKATIEDGGGVLFRGFWRKRLDVWTSHGDTVTEVPSTFRITAMSTSGGIAAMECREKDIYCVQFHPEVHGTPKGKTMLKNFCKKARCHKDFSSAGLVNELRAEIAELMAEPHRKALLPFSGGVDSTIVATLVASVLGVRALALLIDFGNLREYDVADAKKHAELAGINLQIVDAKKELLEALKGVTDAKEKRKIVQNVYRAVIMRVAELFGATDIIQGTLAADQIESGATGGDNIKLHHNVGIDFSPYRQLHPLQEIFKYEARILAKLLGLPPSVVNRKPFPGPGLIIRILNAEVTDELLDMLRWADARVTEVLIKHRIYGKINQLVVAYDGTKTVCIRGDGRAYLGSIFVRSVITRDFMTARGVYYPERCWREIQAVLQTHKLIGRVLPDSTHKPPGPTEYQ